jgi:hypothetical protein
LKTKRTTEAIEMARGLLAITGIDFDRSDKLTQALVGTFLFGMLSAHAMASKSTPAEANEDAIVVFQDALQYTPEAAQEGVQNCIEATRPGVHDTMNAILHRGIDGHQQYASGDLNGLRENLQSVLSHFQNRS